MNPPRPAHASASPRDAVRRCGRLAVVLAATLCAAPAAPAPFDDWSFRPLDPPRLVAPPAADRGGFGPPLALVADDGSTEGVFGIGAATARQFLWFQAYSPPFSNVTLDEVHVLFPSDPRIAPGASIQIVVYADDDGDPTNGATLRSSTAGSVQFADGVSFSVYGISPPVEVSHGASIYLGVVNRYVVSGTTPLHQPAALDTSSGSGDAWVAVWSGDPPSTPTLPPDAALFPVDTLVPGNWMIRGYGTASGLEVPAGGTMAWFLLTAALAALGIWRLRTS